MRISPHLFNGYSISSVGYFTASKTSISRAVFLEVFVGQFPSVQSYKLSSLKSKGCYYTCSQVDKSGQVSVHY